MTNESDDDSDKFYKACWEVIWPAHPTLQCYNNVTFVFQDDDTEEESDVSSSKRTPARRGGGGKPQAKKTPTTTRGKAKSISPIVSHSFFLKYPGDF